MSDTDEPVAWAVTPTGKDGEIDCEFVYPSAATAGDVAIGCNGVVLPLYRHPQPTLTDEEREAIEWFVGFGADRPAKAINITRTLMDRRRDGAAAATLRALLERLGGDR
jgi:hypothetical protein